MNKKLWVGLYFVSLLLVLGALLIEAVLGVLLYDTIVHPRDVAVPMIVLGVLAYLQFVVVHTVITLAVLYKIWDSVQDGITQVTPGKAIGFLFVPFYNLYWIFRVWAGYPKDHDEFIERQRLSAPKLSGTLFTLFPILVLLSAIFVLPILILPFFTLFLIGRACDAVNNLNVAKAAAVEGRLPTAASFIGTPENPRSKIPALALAGAFAFAGIVILGFGVFSWFNLYPKPSADMVAQKVGDFTLQPGGRSSGSFLGRRKTFWETYVSDSGGKKKAIDYNVDVYPDDSLPKQRIASACTGSTAEPITDASGKEVGKACLSYGNPFLQQANFIMRIQAPGSYDLSRLGAEAANLIEMTDFAKALPLNAGLTFTLTTSGSSSTTSSTSSSSGDTTSVSKDAKPDFTFNARDFYRETNGKDKAALSKFDGKVIQVTARFYSLSGSSVMLQAGKDSFFANFESAEAGQFEGAKKDDRLTVKCVGKNTFQLRLENCTLVENRKIVSTEDTPEVTLTAQQYWDTVASYKLPSATRNQKWDELRGKIIKVTGKVRDVSGDTLNLSVADNQYVGCKADTEHVGALSSLTPGQDVTLFSVHGVTSLEHCIVIGR